MKKSFLYIVSFFVLIIVSCSKKSSTDPTDIIKTVILSYSPAEVANSFKNLTGYNLVVTYDSQYAYIKSTGLPTHKIMKGITGWNSQTAVPYVITMKIPVKAQFATTPTAHLVDGPIAIAVNGIPIFEPTKQGANYTDAGDPLIQGELDSCGGHCGRGDDYHYHIAPLCIMNSLTPSQPVAWALDGFPIFGFKEVDGSTLNKSSLDTLMGHTFQNNYHYHTSTTRPYINKGFKGTLQTNILPTVQSIRPTGAVIKTLITDYYNDANGWTVLKYQKNGGIAQMNFRLKSGSTTCYDFVEINELGVTTSTSSACRQ
jgi:hypothetical protein